MSRQTVEAPGPTSVAPKDMMWPWSGVVEHSPVALVLIDGRQDTRGQVMYANEAASAIFAQSRSMLPEDGPAHPVSIFALLHQADAHTLAERFDQLAFRDSTRQLDAVQDPISMTACAVNPARPEETLTLYLQPLRDSTVIVQLVPGVAATSVEQVLVEQQRFRSALIELTELAYSTTDDDNFYQRLIERAVEVVPGAQGGSVQLNLPGTASFRFVAASGYDLNGLQLHDLERDHFFRDTFNPIAQIVRDFDIDGRSDQVTDWLEMHGRLSEIVVNVSAPVIVDGLPVAFLSLDNFEDSNSFNETSIEMTTVLSRLIGSLWQRRELESQLRSEREAFRQEALHDPLTALPNRRNLERLMSEALESSSRREHPSAVLFIDLDDFKGVNDRLGHEVGDHLLIGVANGLKDVVRIGDVVGRWGGDEFLAFPVRLESFEGVQNLAGRILEYFEEELVLDSGLHFRARLTVGIGWSKDSSVTSSQLVSTADEALYEAKAAGKGVYRLRTI